MPGPGVYIGYSRPSSYSFEEMTELLQSVTGDARRELIHSLVEDSIPGSIGPYSGSREADFQFNNEVNHRIFGNRIINRSIFPNDIGLGGALQLLVPAETRLGTYQVPEVAVVDTSHNKMVIDCDMAIVVTEESHETARRVGRITCSWTKSAVTVELVDHGYKCRWKWCKGTNLLQVAILELWIWDIVSVTEEWGSTKPGPGELEGTRLIFRGEHTCMEIGCSQEHMVDDRFDLVVRGCKVTRHHSDAVWKYPMRLALTNERRKLAIHMNKELRECIRQSIKSMRIVETKCNWLPADRAVNLSAGTTVVYSRSMRSIADSIENLGSQVEIQTTLELGGISLADPDHLAQSGEWYEQCKAKYEREDAHEGLIENGRTTTCSNVVRPPKMYNITLRRVVNTATWSEDTWDKSFFLSYVWGQWTDDALAEKLSQLEVSLGWHHCWVDRWCIDQASPEDKEEQLPKMGDYYEGAQVVVALMPDITERWHGLVTTRGEMIHAEAMISVNGEFLWQYGKSQWMHRVWTFQEGYRASNILLSTQTQLLDMTVVHTMSMVLTRGWWNNGFLTIAGFTNPGCVTTDASNHFITHISQSIGTIAAKKRLIHGNHPPTMDTNLAGMLLLTSHRACTVEQDRLHAIIGIVDHAHIEVDYHTSLGDRLRALARHGILDSRIMFGDSVSKTPNECWLPAFGEGRVITTATPGVDAGRISPLSNGRVEVEARKTTGKIDKDVFIMSGFERARLCYISPIEEDDVTAEDTFLIIKGSDGNGEGLLIAGKASATGRILHRRWGKVIFLKGWQLIEPVEKWEIGDNS